MTSPLDRMIDEACGVKPGDFVTMRCSTCQKQKLAPRHEMDPEGTAVVQSDCPGCARAGDKDYVIQYFDAHGQELRFESEAAAPNGA